MVAYIYNWLKTHGQVKEWIGAWVPGSVIHSVRFVLDRKYRSNNSLLKAPKLYVNWIAAKVATHLPLILWPIYIASKMGKVYFLVNNISTSPGHVTMELDWFFRRLEAGELPTDRRYVVVWLRSEVSRCAAEVYRNRFYAFIVNDFTYCILLPLIMRYSVITIDCGLSTLNLTLQREQYVKASGAMQRYGLAVRSQPRPYIEVWDRHASYYALREKTQRFYPMKPGHSMSIQLVEFLSGYCEKYAVIQIKTTAVNSTAAVTDPLTYLEAIGFLKETGYGIVFAGREQMPEVFQRFGVLNYAEWKGASFFHDLELIAASRFVLSSASGFYLLADTMGIPLVCSNSWHLGVPPPGHLSVSVPTLLHESNGELMRFCDQINYFYSRTESNSPPPKWMNPRNATSSEILEAVKEALSLGESFSNLSDLQSRFKALRPGSPLYVAQSRLSKHFIERFQHLL